MLSEQKLSMKLVVIGAVLLIAAVKGESPFSLVGVQLCNQQWFRAYYIFHLLFCHAIGPRNIYVV